MDMASPCRAVPAVVMLGLGWDGSDDAGQDEAATNALPAAVLAKALALIGLVLGAVLAVRVHADPGHHVIERVLFDEEGHAHAALIGKVRELPGFQVRFGNGCHALSFPSGCSCGKRMVVAYRLASVVTHSVRPCRVGETERSRPACRTADRVAGP